MWCKDVIRKLVGCIPDTIQLATGAETEINTKKVRCPRPMNVPLAMPILARYKRERIERVLSRGQKDSTYHGKDAKWGFHDPRTSKEITQQLAPSG
jgi:hypothetical protein